MDHDAQLVAPESAGRVSRIVHWIDVRTGIKKLARTALDEPIPGGARWAYVFGSGLLFIFLLQVITGVSLALYYTPTAETAHTSVAYITKQVAGGAFLRSLHSYGSSAMIIVLALHFLQTFFYGSFKGRRELLWLSGATLSFLVLGMGFTGYLLPWDQKAYFATAVGTNVAGEVPIIGSLLTRFLRAGDTIGTLTISRFYVAHVFLIPAAIIAFIGAHILLFRKAGPAGPPSEDPISPKLPVETFYPRQVLMDMGFALVIMAALSGLSYLRPVTLSPIANPADAHFLPRPEWYYLPMFEWLKFWEGPTVVIGIVVVPGLLAGAFFLMPFLDRRLERKPWRRPIPALAVAIVVLGMVFLGVRSQIDDKQGPIAAQLALQHEQEEAYSKTPFEPYVGAADGMTVAAPPTGAQNPQVAEGKAVFTQRGCAGCHGPTGAGTSAAPSLVGVTTRYPGDNLIALLHSPNARMRAGQMPAVDAPPSEMSALVAYLGALGTRAALVPAVYSLPSPSGSSLSKASASVPTRDYSGKTVINSTASAAAGQQFFQEMACFACHGQAGAGGRAPALAPLISKVSNAELTSLLANPNAAMKKGGMPPIQGTPEQIGSLIVYLRTLHAPRQPGPKSTETIAHVESNSPETPAAPVASVATSTQSNAAAPGETTVAAAETAPGRALFRANGCVACHGINAQGTPLAPSLVGVADKYPGDKLPTLLHNPTKKMQEGGMPPITLDDKQIEDLVAYLSSLRTDANKPAKTEKATETVKENQGLSQLDAPSPEPSGSRQNPR
jgi:ubiquinol-cytochrome c reductase cytochrome b subunit